MREFILILYMLAIFSIFYTLLLLLAMYLNQEKALRILTLEFLKAKPNTFVIKKDFFKPKSKLKKSDIENHNEDNPDYQYMSDEEVKEKYKGLDFSKVEVIFAPSFTYDIKTKEINPNNITEVISDDNDNILKVLVENNENVRRYSVRSYDISKENLPKEMDKLNKFNKIAIFRHKTEYFRYAILDHIK